VIGRHALSGLENYSHAWLLFVFNENTDAHKAGYKRRVSFGKFERSSHKEYVTPPQAGGEKVHAIIVIIIIVMLVLGCNRLDCAPIAVSREHKCATEDGQLVLEPHSHYIIYY
jgi:hypothetical protein